MTRGNQKKSLLHVKSKDSNVFLSRNVLNEILFQVMVSFIMNCYDVILIFLTIVKNGLSNEINLK